MHKAMDMAIEIMRNEHVDDSYMITVAHADDAVAVSYTHLDVYKRQLCG